MMEETEEAQELIILLEGIILLVVHICFAP
jgi:hypothetical protein